MLIWVTLGAHRYAALLRLLMLGWLFFVDDVYSISSSIFLVHFGRLWIYFVSMWHLVLSDPSATHDKPSGPAGT